MPTARRKDKGQFNGSIGDGIRVPRPAPTVRGGYRVVRVASSTPGTEAGNVVLTRWMSRAEATSHAQGLLKGEQGSLLRIEARGGGFYHVPHPIPPHLRTAETTPSPDFSRAQEESDSPFRIELTTEQNAKLKAALYPARQDLETEATDHQAASVNTQARLYWSEVEQGLRDPNAVDDPWI